ncbi:MAG: hypothetical protein M0P69_16130 [Bacteroidales bacterium]|nr:hypothetical protein [Bacteroidales bacterium]
MATSDAIGEILSIATGSSLNIKPTAPAEWIVHNIYVPEGLSAEIYFTNGTDDILVDTISGSYLGYFFHAKATLYLKVKNTSGSAMKIGYDGIAVK